MNGKFLLKMDPGLRRGDDEWRKRERERQLTSIALLGLEPEVMISIQKTAACR
jgi:hypothetical protein